MSVTRERKKPNRLLWRCEPNTVLNYESEVGEFEKLLLILPGSRVYEPRVSVQSHLLWKKKNHIWIYFSEFCSKTVENISIIAETFMWGSYSWNALSAAFWEHRVKKWLDWEKRETKRFRLETLYVSVFLKSGVPSLCDNRDPGVDCVGEPRPEMPPAVLEQDQDQQSSPWKVVRHTVDGSKAELRLWFMLTLITATRLHYSSEDTVCTPQLTLNWFEETTSPITFPGDDSNIEDSLICSNCRPLTHYYSIWFSVDVHQKHTNMNAFVVLGR